MLIILRRIKIAVNLCLEYEVHLSSSSHTSSLTFIQSLPAARVYTCMNVAQLLHMFDYRLAPAICTTS